MSPQYLSNDLQHAIIWVFPSFLLLNSLEFSNCDKAAITSIEIKIDSAKPTGLF
jgi:hypothetical protein